MSSTFKAPIIQVRHKSRRAKFAHCLVIFHHTRSVSSAAQSFTRILTFKVDASLISRAATVFKANRDRWLALLVTHANRLMIEDMAGLARLAWGAMAGSLAYFVQASQVQRASIIRGALVRAPRASQFTSCIDDQLVFALAWSLVKACHTFLIGWTDWGGTTGRFTHAYIGLTVHVTGTVRIGAALDCHHWGNRVVGFAVRVGFASDKGAACVTFGASTSGSVVDDFTNGIGAACSSEWAGILALASNAWFVNGAISVRLTLFV